MLQRTILLLLLCSMNLGAMAAKPATSDDIQGSEKQIFSANAYDNLRGKKTGWFQKKQRNWMQRQASKKKRGVFPHRENLTKGIQGLPFFGSLLTLGIVFVVMLFTAKDKNSLKWAFWGFAIVMAVIAVSVVGAAIAY
jgi:hypothetical protein